MPSTNPLPPPPAVDETPVHWADRMALRLLLGCVLLMWLTAFFGFAADWLRR
jgi:hypothetical protein